MFDLPIRCPNSGKTLKTVKVLGERRGVFAHTLSGWQAVLLSSLRKHLVGRLGELPDHKIWRDAARDFEDIGQAGTNFEPVVLNPIECVPHKYRDLHRFNADVAEAHVTLKQRRFGNRRRHFKYSHVCIF